MKQIEFLYSRMTLEPSARLRATRQFLRMIFYLEWYFLVFVVIPLEEKHKNICLTGGV